MEIAPDLVRRLKRLRRGGLVPTLPDRATHARQAKLSPVEFLELLLQDEIDRRDSQGLARRVEAAGFDEVVTYEQLVWDTPVSYARARVRELFALHGLAAKENVIFCGPVGVGKSWFARPSATAPAGRGTMSATPRSPSSSSPSISPAPTTPSSVNCAAGSPGISSCSTTSVSDSSAPSRPATSTMSSSSGIGGRPR